VNPQRTSRLGGDFGGPVSASKIPFVADKAQRLTSRLLSHGSRTSAALATAFFLGRALLLRIQPQRFELPTPFRRSVTQSLDVDASREATFHRSADQLGRKKGERDGHVDMRCIARAMLFAKRRWRILS
jgi:hypothetical protein